MGKRLNPHRRLLARQAALKQAAQNAGYEPDCGKLQQGIVRSALNLRVKPHRAMKPHSKFADNPPDPVKVTGYKLLRY
jgi:hypothetical protein